MEPTFGDRLQAARKRVGSQQALADMIGRHVRTIRNWETGKSEPNVGDLAELRRVLGDFDAPERDPVEAAIRASPLTEDRQYVVLAAYKRELRQQDEEEGERSLSQFSS